MGSGRGGGGAKVLFNVSVQNSSWAPVKVMMSPENTVSELTEAAVAVYVERQHRPLLASSDPSFYELHLSQFHLESLEPGQKLKALKSRNFYVCKKI